jgi:hypothetical protein
MMNCSKKRCDEEDQVMVSDQLEFKINLAREYIVNKLSKKSMLEINHIVSSFDELLSPSSISAGIRQGRISQSSNKTFIIKAFENLSDDTELNLRDEIDDWIMNNLGEKIDLERQRLKMVVENIHVWNCHDLNNLENFKEMLSKNHEKFPHILIVSKGNITLKTDSQRISFREGDIISLAHESICEDISLSKGSQVKYLSIGEMFANLLEH